MKGVDKAMGVDPANAALVSLWAVFAVLVPMGLRLTFGSPAIFCTFVAATIGSVVWLVGQGGANEKLQVGLSMANKWTDSTAVMILAIPITIATTPFINWALWAWFGLWAVFAQYAALYAYYLLVYLDTAPAETTKFIEFADAGLKAAWGQKKIPICILYESYCEGKLTFKPPGARRQSPTIGSKRSLNPNSYILTYTIHAANYATYPASFAIHSQLPVLI
ncbi:hypothetical protein T492DRAFT_1142382 [Pavlovales sp. CCMP2436]|nr:hypothetical protein T492DRAFT_1142382 [Pavlovales sp. CCMP2436]